MNKTVGLPSMSNQRASEDVKTPSTSAEGVSAGVMTGLISEEQFRRMLCRERKRSERSRKHLLLMLIDSKGISNRKGATALMGKLASVLGQTIRETDLAGWFETGSVLGVIFTELGGTDVSAAVKIIESKVTVGFQKAFKAEQLSDFQQRVRLTLLTEWRGTLIAGDLEALDAFCRLWPVEHDKDRRDQIRRALQQLAALGLIAKVSVRQTQDDGEVLFVDGFRPFRDEEVNPSRDYEALKPLLRTAGNEA